MGRQHPEPAAPGSKRQATRPKTRVGYGRPSTAMRTSLVALIIAATPVAAELAFEQTSHFVWDRPEDYFGGWSAIEILDDGNSFIAIGDNSQIYEGRLERQGKAIVGVSRKPIGALVDTDGTAFFQKEIEHIGDSEGLAALDTGRFAVSFERFPRVLIYGETGLPTRIELPREAIGLAENGGVEALAVDTEGRLIAIPETIPKGGVGFPVWRQTPDGWETLGHLVRSQGFRPVGADIGPEGRLYVLERAFHMVGFQSRIRAFSLEDFDPSGQLIWTTPLGAFDNLEGLSVWKDSEGALRFTMISDDNNLVIQETQIIEFRLTQ